jgi:hypothetical protein
VGLLGSLGTRKQFGEVVVHAGHSEIRLALERLTQIVAAVRVFAGEFDDGEDEVVGLVQ